ncbi:hypothetical protein [Paenibacillus wenxiniae]|uniref:Uncharacterized protein n=1 Tax=Paenibacillus wenxiniae TaxID=1636843 RepID=A0ABW4RKW7_9BACL
MSILFSNVNLNRIHFMDDSPDITFEFIDSIYNRHRRVGDIICKQVSLFQMKTTLDDTNEVIFPCFVCDVVVEQLDAVHATSKSGECYQLQTLGSEISITVVCGILEVSPISD